MGAVAPERILRELADLWVTLGKPGESESGAGVLRACTMTLVVMAEESDDQAALGETIAALMPEHPARAIVIRLRGAGERALEARVYAQCWMPFGQRRQICCEQVEIAASDAALADLPSVVRPLAVADLPLILWCRSARVARMPVFREIAAMAHKVVLDSAGFADARDAVRRMAEFVESGLLLGDLAWTRLTRWREMLSQVFENRRYLEELPRVTAVRVGFGPPLEASAWYMGAWVGNALPGAKVSVAPAAGLEVTLEGEGFRVELARREDRLVVTVNDLANCTSLSQPSDYLLMREELGIARRDPVFEKVLASAAAKGRRRVSPDAEAAAEECAGRVLELLGEALAEREVATLAISGGSTPRLLFEKLARAKFRWDRVHLFWVDERCVPPEDPASNYKLANDGLIQPAQIPQRQVHRVFGEMEPAAAAERYARDIREFFTLSPGEIPRFDVVHRGMGPDAHTASLFPRDPLIDDREGIAAATFASKFNQWRVTLLPAVLLAARHTVMLVAGADKAEALRAVLGEVYDPKRFPAQLGAAEAEWFVDEAAGSALRHALPGSPPV